MVGAKVEQEVRGDWPLAGGLSNDGGLVPLGRGADKRASSCSRALQGLQHLQHSLVGRLGGVNGAEPGQLPLIPLYLGVLSRRADSDQQPL